MTKFPACAGVTAIMSIGAILSGAELIAITPIPVIITGNFDFHQEAAKDKMWEHWRLKVVSSCNFEHWTLK